MVPAVRRNSGGLDSVPLVVTRDAVPVVGMLRAKWFRQVPRVCGRLGNAGAAHRNARPCPPAGQALRSRSGRYLNDNGNWVRLSAKGLDERPACVMRKSSEHPLARVSRVILNEVKDLPRSETGSRDPIRR